MYLNCHSYYSLRYGTIPIEELVQMGAKCGAETLALTDINTTNGIFDFISECRKLNINSLVGAEFRVDNQLLYVAIVQNEEGLKEINTLLSDKNVNGKPFPKFAPLWNDVIVIYPILQHPTQLRDNEYIGINKNNLSILYNREFKKYQHKLVLLQPVTIRNQREWQLHKILRCIDRNIVLPRLAEGDYCPSSDFMQPMDVIRRKVIDYPFLIKNTEKLIKSCGFDFDFSIMRNIAHYTDSQYEDKSLLERLVQEGFEDRYLANDEKAKARVEKELQIINELGFTAYFLCTWDIIRYSLSRGFFHVGRGSGANSIVAYILKITNVCPLELDLYFERFLNPARKSPPDFDIDWSWDTRDEVLDYIFDRFGKERTAFCGVIGTFKHRSCYREIGKVFGLPKSDLDLLTRGSFEVKKMSKEVQTVSYYKSLLEGFPNQRSMHSCGVFISEKPILYYSALDMYPKGYQTTQMDMYTAEDIGFEKFDILSQRGLGTIHSAIDMVKENRGETIDFNNVNLYKDNPICNEAIAKGQTLGCFYVESPAMRGLLRRLKANSYKVLVAASSVIRPGVAKSGMLREYQTRHNNPEKTTYPHPSFEEHLGETYGIMVYQEDVMKIAHHFGGLSMADADILRRGMSGKTRSKDELIKVKEKFFSNCKELGRPLKLVNEVYRQIESFAGYSFCKSHSASYAVESYLAVYLKVKYPLEFMVAAINNFGGFYRREVYFHEAKMAGGILHNPCVNVSSFYTRLKGRDIYVGFVHMNGFDQSVANRIVQEREVNGAYSSLQNFVSRVDIGKEHLKQLVYVGGFDFTGVAKNKLLIEAIMLHSVYEKKHLESSLSLFQESVKPFKIPDIERSSFESAFDEMEIIDFTVTNSVFDLLKTEYRGNVKAAELHKYVGMKVRLVGYTICRKRVPTVKGEMSFFSFWDVEGIHFETTSFPNILKRYP
ncbi:DNA polymerase III subunit alpha, partial [Cyclobacteriaceae bacterium]|nr:DNA polymerase III subunit alpha [Cyclobacteriaceae bacterium]